MSEIGTKTFDVVAVDLTTRLVRLLAEDKTEIDAEAIVCMAVGRLGVESEFFAPVVHGSYGVGDEWHGSGY